MFGGGEFDISAWTAADAAASNAPTGETFAAQQQAQQPEILTPSIHSREPVNFNTSVPPRTGDWQCGDCGNVNFAKRVRCHKCGGKKQHSSAGASRGPNDTPPGPPGLYRPGDWACNHCGNVNWARRLRCNVCHATREVDGGEARTGRGGGHYDLQDPQDKLEHDSDDEEYDEFGRKKKRQKRASARKPTSSNTETDADGAAAGQRTDGAARNYSGFPITLHFPPPPRCYLLGRTMSMGSLSSRSSDYYAEGEVSSEDSEGELCDMTSSGYSKKRYVEPQSDSKDYCD